MRVIRRHIGDILTVRRHHRRYLMLAALCFAALC